MNYLSALSAAKKIISKNKTDALTKADTMLALALENPNFKVCYGKMKDLQLAVAKNEYSGKSDKAAETQLKNTEDNLKAIAKEIGIDLKTFQPQFKCALCSDNGYFNGEMCQCLKKELLQQLSSDCGFISSNVSFENSNGNLTAEKCKEWCDKFPNGKKRNIFFSGPTGTGKTYLTQCIYKNLIENGFTANYLTAFALNQKFLQIHRDFNGDSRNSWFELFECDLLIVDDLGAEPIYNNVTVEYLFNLFNERLIAGKSFIVSSNLSTEKILQRYGERLLSRICDKSATHLFEIKGGDLRLESAATRI